MSPKARSFLGMRLDNQFSVTWIVGGMLTIFGFVLTQYTRISNSERINAEQDKEIAQIQQQMEADRKANQEIRESVIAFNGKMDTLNVKMDGMRSLLSINSIKSDQPAR